MEIPTIQSSRLILCPFRDDDLDAHAAMNADTVIMRYIGDVEGRSAA
jgi:RimJ/RimL family protein N-acetyltransferase